MEAVVVVSPQRERAATAFGPRLKLGLDVLNAADAYPDRIADRALIQGGSISYPEVGGVGTIGREYFVRVSSRF